MLSRIINSVRLAPSYLNKAPLTALHTFSTTQKPLSEKVKFSVYDADMDDTGIAKTILINDFTAKKEPVCYQISSRNFEYFLSPYLKRAIDEELSVVVNVNDAFAGITVNSDFTVKEEKAFLDELRKRDYYGFELLFGIIKDLNYNFRVEMHEKDLLRKGNILRMTMVGIDPYQTNQGLGTLLTEQTVEMAKEKGYKYVTCAATNHHMKHSCLKAGFKVQSSIKYAEWEYPKGSGIYPKSGMEEVTGFDEICFMVYKLPVKDKKIKEGPKFRPN